MKVLSLFDGMSCLRIALKDMDIPVETYYASEIDKYAIIQTEHNFPDTIQVGDVTSWREWDIDWASIGLIGAGSPCQGFSFAGKQLAFDDPRSKLFFVFIDILNHVRKSNPDVMFLLENVRMKSEHEAAITQYCGVNPLYINSNLVSAQNRDRIYWTNIGMVQHGLLGEYYLGIPQPEDRGILLRDILESEVAEKYYLSEKMITGLIGHSDKKQSEGCGFKFKPKELDQKGNTITQRCHKMGVDDNYIVDNKLTPFGNSQDQKISPTNGKSQTLNSGHFNQPKIAESAAIRFGRSDEGKRLRREAMRNGKDHTPFQAKEIVGFNTDKMNTLTGAITKDNLVMQINPSLESGGKQPYQQNRVYDSNGIAPALCSNKADLLIKVGNIYPSGGENGNVFSANGKSPTIKSGETSTIGNRGVGSCNSPKIALQSRIRRLTTTECARLQTIPDWYKWIVSDTQIYRMLGNGWTVSVIKHILSYMDFSCLHPLRKVD